ncbi:uncharacterized protein K02A2.6-like [Cydia pomonella]|uniref:uncharacterized protein K02A2.6-like n=1 Tax=Cydia pomonella TaxID=82600 RepID=UPI002ADE3381|nr:uncharacterized protein K02A2.6-like [Cydia pomonella]
MPLGSVECFRVGSDWDAYVRRVKQFITLNAIDDNLHVASLVTLVGAECYELMCDLCAPSKPEDQTFDDLVKLVREHLEPERSEIAERHIFRQRKQLLGESIREYLQNLKHLAKTCNFGTGLEVNLRDQFVSGLLSEEMRSRLFAVRAIDYKRAVELALALEAAEKHAAVGAPAGASASASASAPPNDGLHRVGAARRRGAGPAAAATAAPRAPCARCGKTGHAEGRCRYKQFSCDACGEKGHLKVMCRKEVSKKSTKGQYFLNDSDSDDSNCHFYKIDSDVDIGDGPFYVTLTMQKIRCKFEVDTGSRISAISKDYYDRCFSHLPLQNKMLRFRSYIGDPIKTVGYLDVEVGYGNNVDRLKLYVIENGGPPLMGRTWIRRLKLRVTDCINFQGEDSMAESLKQEFPEVFAGGLGTFKSRLQLRLKDDTPVFVKARALPLALRERVERELDRLQREGVIYKVDRSEYGTPIVPVVKANGTIRICGDYKITINPRLKDFHYPLPRIEDLFALLGGGEQYTKLDLSNAFQQCVLEKESQPMTAITTHVGTFVYKRVPFGIKCIPENFQKIMEETLSGLPSTAVFADDICVTGKDKATHMSNLRAVLQRLKENGLRINFAKCQFFKDSVNYLGYRIDKYGLHTDERKIAAIVNAPAPSNLTQLKSFMGLVNFYAKFCANMSDILKPMYSLLKKNVKWNWDESCDDAFKKIKKVLSSAPVLAHYNPSLPLILSVDSSPYGLGAALTQRGADGVERPLCCASRTLNAAECNYSQIDKEALAIVFGVTKHHQYVYGRKFTLRTDHRALSYIFGKNKGLPVTAASRLQRYAVKLAAYDFNIEFIRSERNCYADALSRLPLVSQNRPSIKDEGCSYLNFVEGDFPLSFKEVKSELAKDPVLSKIYGYVMFGWPNNSSESEKPYFNRKESLNIDQGCLIWGYRVVIPKSLRVAVLNELHGGHPGIVKMKQIARNYVWWDTLDADIERVAEQCAACRAQRPAPAPVPLHSWPWPEEPWARLNLDFLGPFNNVYYLVIIDAHSKWIEVEKIKTGSASMVIDCLRTLFARFGLPKQLVTDNGPPFSSAEFGSYLRRNGIRHTLVAPYHPASNGAAENAVRTIKRVLKKAVIENEKDVAALSRFLFMYRNTEHSTTKKEPAVALLGRRLRGRLDLLRPDTADVVRTAQRASERRSERHAPRQAEQGAEVLVRDYARGAHKWAEGLVLAREGPVSYVVRTSDGRTHKRHVDQLHFRKSRFTLSDIDAKAPNISPVSDQPADKVQVDIPDATGLPADDTDQNDGEGGGEDEYGTPPGTPTKRDERSRRKAAVRCLERFKQM